MRGTVKLLSARCLASGAALTVREILVRYGVCGYHHEELWTTRDVGDVLSAITLVYRLQPTSNGQQSYLREVRAMFAQEDRQAGPRVLAEACTARGRDLDQQLVWGTNLGHQPSWPLTEAL